MLKELENQREQTPTKIVENVDKHWKELSKEAKMRVHEQTNEIAGLLNEKNTFSVSRIVQAFGFELTLAKAKEALDLYEQAQTQGAEAYVVSEHGTIVATRKGRPRTTGGVFFYLMRQISEERGFDYDLWRALTDNPKLNSSNNSKLKEKKSSQTNAPKQKVAPGAAQSSLPPGTVQVLQLQTVVTAAEAENEQSLLNEQLSSPTIKPTRTKATIIGAVANTPKIISRQDGTQLVELSFTASINQTLPKGLPNLGQSEVKVWATSKQWQKVEPEVKAQPSLRLLVEGEVNAGVNRDLKPFLRVVTTRITTVEAEKAKRMAATTNTTNAVTENGNKNEEIKQIKTGQVVENAKATTTLSKTNSTTTNMDSHSREAGSTTTKTSVAGNSGTENQKPKATAVKLVVTGTLLDNPKLVIQEDGQPLVTLIFQSEMNAASLPKGLPNLGGIKVEALCTPKQWQKVAGVATQQTRFLLEGEGIAAANVEDLQPYIKLICLNVKILN